MLADLSNDVAVAHVQKRCDDWKFLWKNSAGIFYAIGTLSVAASAAAAIGLGNDGDLSQIFAATAAVLTALMGFWNPEKRYIKFVGPWRTLDIALLRYKIGLIDLPQLLAILEKCEASIDRFEQSDEDPDNFSN